MHKIKITAIRKADYKDLQQKYENPIQHACDIQEGHLMAQPNAWFRSSLSSSDTYVRSRNKLRSVCLESFTHVIGRKNWLFSQDLKLAPKVPVSYLLLLKTQNSIN